MAMMFEDAEGQLFLSYSNAFVIALNLLPGIYGFFETARKHVSYQAGPCTGLCTVEYHTSPGKVYSLHGCFSALLSTWLHMRHAYPSKHRKTCHVDHDYSDVPNPKVGRRSVQLISDTPNCPKLIPPSYYWTRPKCPPTIYSTRGSVARCFTFASGVV
jgi:hypothetical protein